MLGNQNYGTPQGQLNDFQTKAAYIDGAGSKIASEADVFLDRLRMLLGKLSEIHISSRMVVDKIVGPAPEKLPGNPNAPQIGAAAAQGFLHTSSALIGDADAVASDIAEQLARLHRSF